MEQLPTVVAVGHKVPQPNFTAIKDEPLSCIPELLTDNNKTTPF